MKNTIKAITYSLLAIGLILSFTSCGSSTATKPDAKAEQAKMDKAKAAKDLMANQANSVEAFRVAWDTQDVSKLADCITPDFQRYLNGNLEADGIEALKAHMTKRFAVHKANVKIRGEVDYKGNKAYLPWTYSGTNIGALGEGIPATNKEFSADGFSVVTFDDSGKLKKTEVYSDNWGFMEQLGYTLVPPSGE